MEWTEMLYKIHSWGCDSELTYYWNDGVILKGFFEGINETCDCRVGGDEDYEYYMCIVKVTEILLPSPDYEFYAKVGDIIEVSEIFEPIKICAEGKGIVWEKYPIDI